MINIFISIILGLIISYFFSTYILFNQKQKLKGPNSNSVRKKIYIDENNICFSFVPIPYICPISS